MQQWTKNLFFGWASSFKGFGWFLSLVVGGTVVTTLFGVRGVSLAGAVFYVARVPMLQLRVGTEITPHFRGRASDAIFRRSSVTVPST